MSKRVVFAVTRSGTAKTFYRGYLGYLKEKGWLPTIVADRADVLQEFARSEGVSWHAISMRRDPNPLADIKSFVDWYIYLRSSQPDVLVAATPKASFLSIVAGRLAGVPVRVYQIWGLRLETETGFRRYVLRLFERLTISQATTVVCNSHSLAAAVKQEGVMGRRVATVLGEGSSHGVDLEKFAPDANIPPLPEATVDFLARERDSFKVVFVGRIQEAKGIITLLDALKILDERTGTPVAAIIVGGTESETAGAAVAQAAATLRVHNVGQTPDPRPFMLAADVLCLPSRREGFPNVVLEANSLGVPAIVTDATGCVDSVVHEETGLIFPVGDPEALADAIECLRDHPDTLRHMSHAARHRMVTHFDRRVIWELQEELLSERVATHREADMTPRGSVSQP